MRSRHSSDDPENLPTRRRPAAMIGAAGVAALVVACAAATGELAAQAGGSGSTASEVTVLQAGDALEIEIWREKDLSGEFIVDEDGIVTLPLLGRIPVTGIPLRELENDLLERYAVELRNPSIEITPLRRVYVLGEVNEPGIVAVDPTVSLAGAVAMAGGSSVDGDLSRIRIMRDGQVLLDGVGPETDLVSIDVRSGDQIFVDRRSWADRNSAFLVSATIGVASILVQLLR